jgi:hypothetical protein
VGRRAIWAGRRGWAGEEGSRLVGLKGERGVEGFLLSFFKPFQI